jgi:serine/threonine protein kinase
VVARLGSLPPAIVLAWGDALCEALACLHEHGIVHGHVSPRNIFLGEDEARPRVRLLDTQLLLFRGHGCVAGKGTLVGAEYLAPERILRQRGTEQSDVYALGVTLFELLMGRPPFRGKSVGETRLMHLRTAPPWLPPSLSAFTPVIHGCLAKRPEERFASALDVREALRGVTLAA